MALEHQTWQNATEITPWTHGEVPFYGRWNFNLWINSSAKLTISFQHPLIDANNKSGSLEFSVGGNPDDFFPVTLAFNSTKSFSGIKVRVLIISKRLFVLIWDNSSGSRLCGGWRREPSETFNKHNILCREIRSCLKPGNFHRLHFPYFPTLVPNGGSWEVGVKIYIYDWFWQVDFFSWNNGRRVWQARCKVTPSVTILWWRGHPSFALFVANVIHDYYLLSWRETPERGSRVLKSVKWNDWMRFKLFSTSRSLEP